MTDSEDDIPECTEISQKPSPPPGVAAVRSLRRLKPVQRLGANDLVIAEYASATECAKALGLSKGKVGAVCNGKQDSTGGYVFRWASPDDGWAPTSGLVGVSWDKRDGKWRSKICIDGRTVHLGFFNTEVEAAERYDETARPFGRPLNFPREGEEKHTYAKCQKIENEKKPGSKYRGVTWKRAQQSWTAQMSINGKQTYLGSFATEEEAANRHDEQARLLGRAVNFPREGERAMKERKTGRGVRTIKPREDFPPYGGSKGALAEALALATGGGGGLLSSTLASALAVASSSSPSSSSSSSSSSSFSSSSSSSSSSFESSSPSSSSAAAEAMAALAASMPSSSSSAQMLSGELAMYALPPAPMPGVEVPVFSAAPGVSQADGAAESGAERGVSSVEHWGIDV